MWVESTLKSKEVSNPGEFGYKAEFANTCNEKTRSDRPGFHAEGLYPGIPPPLAQVPACKKNRVFPRISATVHVLSKLKLYLIILFSKPSYEIEFWTRPLMELG